MADVINLRTARKQKKRQEKHVKAETSRVLSSLPAKTRKAAEKNKLKAEKFLDGHRLDGSTSTDGS